MSGFHQEEPTCEWAAGYEPAAGDLVVMCTASAVWQVRCVEDDGRVTVDPHSGPGTTWRQPMTITRDHLDLAVSS